MNPKALVNKVTKKIRTALDDDTITDWMLVYKKQEDEVYFKVNNQPYPVTEDKDIITTVLDMKYKKFEKVDNNEIHAIIVEVTSEQIKLQLYYKNLDNNQNELKEECL